MNSNGRKSELCDQLHNSRIIKNANLFFEKGNAISTGL